jgi:hypothetical protein
LLEDKANWAEEPGTELEESVYEATFVNRWGDDIAAGTFDRVVRLLEPYRETECPQWLQ